MKRRTRIYVLMAALVLFMIPVSQIKADAASKDVTATMKEDQKVKEISKLITAYTTAMDISAQSTTKKVNVKLNDANCLSIAAFVRYNYKEDYEYTKAELTKETKDLFGKRAGLGVLSKKKKNMLVCTADKSYTTKPYMYCGGDFGDCIPLYTIQNVVQNKKNVYTVTIQNQMGYYGESGKDVIGTTVIKIKKSAASRYGYTIKSIAYTYAG